MLAKLMTDSIVAGDMNDRSHPVEGIPDRISPCKLAERYIRGEDFQSSSDSNSKRLERFDSKNVTICDLFENQTVDFSSEETLLDKYRVQHVFSEEQVLSGSVKLSEDQLSQFIKGRKGWPKFQKVT